jgi:alkylation response protein AidB-like acyl-CoA dehydrogenase
VYIGYTDEQEKLRQELRSYYAQLLTPDVVEELGKGHGIGEMNRRVVRQMGADGWLGIGWPVEYGGQGRSAMEQFIFFDESMRAGAPVPMLTINTVGPTIMNFGTDEQKDFFLPKILRGELHFCIGYSEPGAGTDLAALKTRAVRDGEEYIINGQKMWTSLAGDADYCWLATRTNPEVKKHKGISMFLVDMKNTPGIRVEPLHLLSEHNINATYFDDVHVPAANLVGGENNGWTLITNQLNHERVTLCSAGIAGSSTRSGCRSAWPGCAPSSSSSS